MKSAGSLWLAACLHPKSNATAPGLVGRISGRHPPGKYSADIRRIFSGHPPDVKSVFLQDIRVNPPDMSRISGGYPLAISAGYSADICSRISAEYPPSICADIRKQYCGYPYT